MKKNILTVGLLILLFVSLLMPLYSLYPHMALDEQIARAFPDSVSGYGLILHGSGALPITAMPSLAVINFREGLLIAGILLTALGALLSLFRRKFLGHIATLIGCAGVLPLILFSFYSQQLDQSILFNVMLTTNWFVWLPLMLSAVLLVMEISALRKQEKLPVSDQMWRRISAALCAVTLFLLVFPFALTSVPSGVLSTAEEDALASRSVSGLQWMINADPLLDTLGDETGLFTAPMQGGMLEELTVLSDSASTVRNLFMIPTHKGGIRAMAIIAAVLMLAGLMLQMIRKVDRWIPTSLITVAAVLFVAEVVSMLAIDSSYQFKGAIYQIIYLGFGGYTLFPLCLGMASTGAAAAAIMSIRQADTPYFVNPIPQKKRLLAVSLTLATSAMVLLCLPIFQINVHTPGRINQANPTVSQPMSGLALVTFQKPDKLMNPHNTRGKALYNEEAAKNDLTLADYQAEITAALRSLGFLALVMLLASLLSVGLLLYRKRNKKLVITILLLSMLIQTATVLVSIWLIPADVGFATSTGALFAAMGFSGFAAFFAGFMDYEELPKKFKLFLMMLPFLVAVFLFAYLPLSGWRYAFYNYKLGLSMDQQEFVGFKWFTSLFSNEAQRSETIRVLRNTFAMSGIGLLTSWLPVAFAIFLTEIRLGFFKKFVQIFTTLPNFISWVLVFSFALSIFSLDTGIVNKLLLKLGLIDEGIAWLNSSEHIWVKMWLWNTWKSLGWSAIMYLAAIAGISQELYEAARVDGAGRWRQIAHITIPGLLPTFFVLLLLQISNVVNNGMEQYLVFQNAMNKSTIEVLDLYVYNISLGTRSSNTISMATAIGILKSLVSIVLLFAANQFSKWVRGDSIV